MSEAVTKKRSRFGFLSHQKASLPIDFDRLGEKDIADLFEGKTICKMETLKGKYPSIPLEEFNQLDEEICSLFMEDGRCL